MDFDSRLASIGLATNQKDKIKGYQDLLAAILEHQDDHATATAHLELFVTAATEESVGLVVSRQALTDLTAAVEGAAQLPAENKKRVYKHALDKVQGRVVSFEEQVSSIRNNLASIYEDEEDWAEAAQVLQGIPLDSGHRIISNEFKVGIYIRIVRLLLEDDEAISAEAYLNRASVLMRDTKDISLQLTFKL
ncbi:hypothetical protein CPC16_006085, partial [Podila verticillata]